MTSACSSNLGCAEDRKKKRTKYFAKPNPRRDNECFCNANCSTTRSYLLVPSKLQELVNK